MKRQSVNVTMMKCAQEFAKRSTCTRVKAGAVIAVDNHIVSTGYNGNAPGQAHCEDYFYNLWDSKYKQPNTIYGDNNNYTKWLTSEEFKKLHHEWAIIHELHGEMNAIIYASKRGISIDGGSIYTTYSPCIFCTKAILQAGIKKVFYNKLYDRKEGHDSVQILKDNGVEVIFIDTEEKK